MFVMIILFFQNFTQRFLRFLIDHEHTFEGLQPMCTTTNVQDEQI